MPRKRRPSAEQQAEDRRMASYVQLACSVLVERNPQSLELKAAERFLSEFANSPIAKPKPRKPKVTPPPAPMWRDGKSAAANDDTRELAHHSV